MPEQTLLILYSFLALEINSLKHYQILSFQILFEDFCLQLKMDFWVYHSYYASS